MNKQDLRRRRVESYQHNFSSSVEPKEAFHLLFTVARRIDAMILVNMLVNPEIDQVYKAVDGFHAATTSMFSHVDASLLTETYSNLTYT